MNVRRLQLMILVFCFASACGKGKAPPNPSAQKQAVIPSNVPPEALDKPRDGVPENLERLTPEAKALWVKAEIKPTVPKNLEKLPPAEQVHMLTTISQLEARQREVDATEDRPAKEAFTKRREQEDREELVNSAPVNFKPEAGRKIKLTLIPRKTMIRKGEAFWYRVELQNVGQETIKFSELPSFWKIGNEDGMRYFFLVTPPGGHEIIVRLAAIHGGAMPSLDEVEFPPNMTEAEKTKYLQQMQKQITEEDYQHGRRSQLQVNLRPGETLVTRPWKLHEALPSEGRYREMASMTARTLDKEGAYRIKFIFHDSPVPGMSEEEILRFIAKGHSRESQMRVYNRMASEHLGRFESNTVVVEVVK